MVGYHDLTRRPLDRLLCRSHPVSVGNVNEHSLHWDTDAYNI